LPEETPQLVINSIFNSDNLVKVNLTESQPINNRSMDFEVVEKADIEIFKNGTSLGYLDCKGNYLSAAKLPFESKASFSLKVKAAGFETAETSEIIPDKPNVIPIKIARDYNNSNTAFKYIAQFSLNDLVGVNFYFLRVWVIRSGISKSYVYF
jgi:hypothetical protein